MYPGADEEEKREEEEEEVCVQSVTTIIRETWLNVTSPYLFSHLSDHLIFILYPGQCEGHVGISC